MSNSLKASPAGLVIVDRSRQRLGWTKTSTARWWQDAHTSKASLRRFWHGDRISKEIFIAICHAVGISDWEAITEKSDFQPDIPSSHLDWYEAPNVESFYGRSQELEQLEQWILQDNCKLILITGIVGIGKTALALTLADQMQSKFSTLVWKSLTTSPSLISLLDSIINTFESTVIQNIEDGIAKLIYHLKQRRCLLILDGIEAKSPEFNNYHQFLRKLSYEQHQSCILITGREQLDTIEFNSQVFRYLHLHGLSNIEALELLHERGLRVNKLVLSALNHLYRGNPLALKLVTPLIESVFAGNVAAFLNQNTIVVGDRWQLILKQQLGSLSHLEQDILYWLAIWQEPISFCRLQSHLLISLDPSTILAAIFSLEKRSLLEKWVSDGQPSFTLQPLVMKVVTDELVENAAQEIHQVIQSNDIQYFHILRTHWLIRPGTDDIAGDKIVRQLTEKLWGLYGGNLEQNLSQIVPLLNHQSPLSIGYIACNIKILSGIQITY